MRTRLNGQRKKGMRTNRRLRWFAAGDAKARAEDDLTRVQDSLAAAKKDKRKLEAEVACLVAFTRA